MCVKHKKILERSLPDALKISIAKKIENNLFSKVFLFESRITALQNKLLLLFKMADYFSLWTQSNG
jgi:hypothetical protein